jgi:hypothetical protein
VARSSTVWLVQYDDGYDSHWPMAAFTVKRELILWLGGLESLENLVVHRMYDGRMTFGVDDGGSSILAAVCADDFLEDPDAPTALARVLSAGTGPSART